MNFKSIISTIALLAIPFMSQAQDPPTTGTFLGDAGLIITSENNDVRLWSHPPRVLVLFEGEDVSPRLEKVRKVIEENVSPFYADTVFGEWIYSELPTDLGEGSHKMHMRYLKGGPAGYELEVRLDDERIWVTDIVIAMAKRPKIAIMNGLWALDRKMNRAMMRAGRSNCFYSSQSRKGVRIAAYVTIVRYAHLARDIEECVWEELLHTLGPLNDAKGSPYFTFDDQPGLEHKKQANDILLLKSLYESGARPGDPPDAILEHLKKLMKEPGAVEIRP